jgi:hypothetical protein
MSDLFQGGGRGAPEGIGPIEGLAPSPGAGRGRILGLPQALRFAGDVGGPLAQFAINRTKAKKDYNDAPADDPVGQAGGKLVNAGAGPIGDAAAAAAL